jgi:arylformamidase
VTLYRGLDQAALDAAYNNSAAVADSAEYLARWTERSERIRRARPGHLDRRFGEAPRARLDYFACGRPGAATLLFIHGGYWQRNAKEIFAFVAEGPLARGINVALTGYTLAPAARLTQIVAEVRGAIAHLLASADSLGFDRHRLLVSGWSAGGHLTAMGMSDARVAGGLAISGIFDLTPIRLCYLNDALALDEREVAELSPLRQIPKRAGPLTVAVGDLELPELQRQSADYFAAWSGRGLPGRFLPLSGHHHFSILEEMAQPDGRLALEVEALSRMARPGGTAPRAAAC